MNYVIEKNGGIYKSHVDNVSWPEIENFQTELNNLQLEIKGNSTTTKKFFERKGDTVIYNMDLVKQYLQSCVEKEILKLNPAIITAVQIALESQDYDVGVIDGLLGSGMRKTVMIFQKQCGLKPDGIPGKETIEEILNILGDSTSTQSRVKARQQMGPKPFPEEQQETKVIQPKYKEGSDFDLINREEFIQNSDILQGPKLEATNPDQVGGIGSSMMRGFSGEDFNNKIFENMSGIKSATTRNHQRYWQKGQIGKLDGNKLKEFCKKKGIKSFVIYFGGNEAAINQTAVNHAYNDIKTIGEYLKEIDVQPVLCTCIGEMKEEHSFLDNGEERIYPLKEFNEKIRDLGTEKGWPVLDYAKIDVGDVWYDKPENKHPSNRGYNAMRQKIIDNLSK